MFMRYILAVATVPVAAAAIASVDPTPPPGGVYRLKPGIYVQDGSTCADAPNAAIRRYDGKGLSTPHTRSCRIKIMRRRGKAYDVTQSCLDAGTGPAKRFSERQRVTVADALTFKLAIGPHDPGSVFRYCPIRELPRDLRQAGLGRP